MEWGVNNNQHKKDRSWEEDIWDRVSGRGTSTFWRPWERSMFGILRNIRKASVAWRKCIWDRKDQEASDSQWQVVDCLIEGVSTLGCLVWDYLGFGSFAGVSKMESHLRILIKRVTWCNSDLKMSFPAACGRQCKRGDQLERDGPSKSWEVSNSGYLECRTNKVF